MDIIASGDYTQEVRGKTRQDELGQFSNAIKDLRKAALESERLREENILACTPSDQVRLIKGIT